MLTMGALERHKVFAGLRRVWVWKSQARINDQANVEHWPRARGASRLRPRAAWITAGCGEGVRELGAGMSVERKLVTAAPPLDRPKPVRARNPSAQPVPTRCLAKASFDSICKDGASVLMAAASDGRSSRDGSVQRPVPGKDRL